MRALIEHPSIFWIKAFIDQNQRRKRKKEYPSRTYRRLKASVERVFSRSEKILNLENVRVRGLRSIIIHVLAAFTAMLAVAVAAKGRRLTKQIRCIRSIFGITTLSNVSCLSKFCRCLK